MKKNNKFPIGPILICLLIAFCFSGCYPGTLTARAITKTQVIEESNLANTLAIGLADRPAEKAEEKFVETPKKTEEILLSAPRQKVEPEIQKIIKENPTEKVQIVMTVKNDEDLAKISKIIKESSGQVNGEFKVGGAISAEITAEKLEEISKDESIEEIALEKEYFAFLSESIPQINIDTVAWAQNYTGKGVKIAILDTGIDTAHEMFGNRILLSRSFNSEGVNDQNGHGSHCAGIAAGNGQYKGAAPDAYLLNAKVLNSQGSGTTSNIIAGINWAVDPDGNESTDDGADIISMSFGGPLTDLDGPLASAIRDAIDEGAVFVAASGNCRQGCGSFFGVTMPGSMPEVITVGAANENNNVAAFSSGDTFNDYIKPDVVAPGVNIMSATKNGGYRSASGTSMSTPMVAGLIALMLEKESLSHAQIKEKLENTAIDLGNSGKDTSYGSGLVNVSALFTESAAEAEKTEENETGITETTSMSPAESRLIAKDIGSFKFVITKNISNNATPASPHNLAIYAKDEKRVYVEEVIFDDVLNFAEYLYLTAPLVSPEKVEFIKGNYSYVLHADKFMWYTENSVYLIETQNISLDDAELIMLLDAYSEKTSNIVGGTFEENMKKLQEIDDKIFEQMHQQAMNELKLSSSEKNISYESQWGAGSTSEAKSKSKYHLTFGDSEGETFWTEKADNWYYLETNERGELEFGIDDIDSGDDLDIYLYDYQVKYMDDSTNNGNANEQIFVTKNTDTTWAFYIKIIPYTIKGSYAEGNIYSSKSCTAQWLDEYDCRSGDERWRKYQESDCGIVWKFSKDCDDYNDPGSWYCEDSDTAKKTSYDGYCNANTDSCYKTPTYYTDDCTSAEKCSSGSCVDKTCSDYSNNYGTCSWANYNAIDPTECKGGNAVECDVFGSTYCWKYIDICTSDEYCSNPLLSPAACFEYECSVDSVSWDKTTAVKDESAGITVQGSHCDSSDYVTFEVKENDCWGVLEANATSMSNDTNFSSQGICNDAVNTQPSKAYFSNNKATSTWTAEYQSDATGNPEYYVYAYLRGDTDADTKSSNSLKVSCKDSDGDGYSPTGGVCGTPTDCNDNNANIKPGASEVCNNQDDDCDGSTDEGFNLQDDNNNCGACGNSCGSSGTCVQGQCHSSVCSGYANTAGSCSTEGQYKRENNKVYECEDQIWWGQLLCWKHVSSKGDSNYCDDLACGWQDYDCDNKDECSGNLICTGSSVCWMAECGCCNSNEEWDSSSNTCKKANGQSCTQDGNCHSSHCVHSTCRPTDPYYGDGYCDADKWETCSNSPQDCKKCDQASCTAGSECQGGYCVHNKCWHNPYINGDGHCDTQSGESPTNSPNDCYGNLDVIQITSYPTTVSQGQNFQVQAVIQNKGTIRDTLKLEAGLPPESWYRLATSSNDTFGIQSYYSITKCCPGNEYYDAVQITLDPGESQTVTFNLKAPTIHSYDACDSGNPKKSAWDSQHQLVVGLYSACGQGYVHYKAKNVKIRDRYCYSANDCWDNEVCDFSKGIPGVCAVAVCENECSTAGAYFCAGNELKQCKDIDNDGCLESEHKDYCVGEYECIDGQSACSQMAVKKIRVDYSNGYTTVNKQPGDTLRLMIDQSGTPSLEYSTSAFELDSCYSGTLSTKECKFTVKDKPGTHTIRLRNGPEVTVKIIKNPKLIIVTDRKELITKFRDEDEVDSMLAQAYRTAAEKDGCIYDLPDYITRDD